MAFNYPLDNVKSILDGLNFVNVFIDNIVEDPSESTVIQEGVFLIPEPSTPTLTNLQTLEFSCYVRHPNIDTASSNIWEIWHALHNKRGNFGTVANNYLKITLIEGLSSPYLYSTQATGANLVEYIARFKISYIDTGFDNY